MRQALRNDVIEQERARVLVGSNPRSLGGSSVHQLLRVIQEFADPPFGSIAATLPRNPCLAVFKAHANWLIVSESDSRIQAAKPWSLVPL